MHPNGTLKPQIPDHEFIIPTPQGAMKLTVADEEMKVCPCGHDLFRALYRVAWIKPPNILNAKPVCMQATVYVCDKCGNEIGPDTSNKRVAALERA